MPEGHLIHHHARTHSAVLTGAAAGPLAISSPQGRFIDEAARVDGRELEAVVPHGKHLLYRFGEDAVVHVHLGMRGLFLIHPVPAADPRPAVRLRMASATAAVDLIAPITCELLDEEGAAAVRSRLGPDPLDPGADVGAVRRSLAGTRRPLGAVLMDQSVVAGIGNVLRAEICYLIRLHPLVPAADVDDATFDRLWTTTVEVMSRAADEGRITTVEVPPPVDGASTSREEGRYVYEQGSCRGCGAPVIRSTLAGRDLWTCSAEQVPPT